MSAMNNKVIIAATKWRPYDYGFTINMLVLQLREMLKFYIDGKGVVQADQSRDRIKEELTEALRLYEEAVNFDDNEFDGLEGFCKESPTEREADAREVQERYDKFFLYVSQHFRNWWD